MKKLLALYLCVIICLTIAIPAIATDDYIPIESVSITFLPPYAGSTAYDPPQAKVPSEGLYIYEDWVSYWREDAGNYSRLDDKTVFEEGTTYLADLTITCGIARADGYQFDSNTIINISNAQIFQYDIEKKDIRVIVRFTPKPPTIINNISLTLQAPSAGSTAEEPPKISTPSGAHYLCDWATWTTDDFKTDLSDNTVFDFYKYYGVEINIEALDGYRFADNPKVNIQNAYYYDGELYGQEYYNKNMTIHAQFSPIKSTKTSLKKPKISKLTTKKKKLTVTWKKLSSEERKKARNIEIQISPDKNFKKDVKKKTLSSAKTSYTFKKLKPGVKYYVRIRTYTNTDNIKYISKWSAKKSKKVKK